MTDSHPMVALGLLHLGRALAREQRYTEAAGSFQRALEIAEASLGPEHPRVGEFLCSYADVLREMKQKREAKRMMKRAEAILRQNQRENLLRHTVDWALTGEAKIVPACGASGLARHAAILAGG